MNRIYKVIWSKVKHQYVVVSELAHSCTKSTSSRIGRSAAAVLAALVLTTGVGALSVQAADPLVEDPYAILNDKIDETNANSSDPIVTLKSTAAAMNTDAVPAAGSDAQSGSSGNTSVATPSGQHTIYNEEGFYAHNGQGTYNSLTKDGLFVGGTDNGEGLYVDNDGNIYTDGNAEIEGSFSAADGNATIAADGTTVIRAGGSQLVVNDGAAGITHGNAIVAVSSNKAEMQGGGSSMIADLNGVTLTERTGNTTVTIDQNGMTVDGDFTVTGDTNLKNTGIDGNLGVSGDTTLNQDLTVGGTSNLRDTSVDGTLGVSGNATFNSDVTVTGNTNLKTASVDGTLGVSGNATFNSDVTVTGNTNLKTASVDGTLGVSGNATFNSDVTVTGNTNLKNASVDGTLNVSDNASFEKNISAVGEIKGGTFANTTNTFSVNDDGDVTAVDITANGALTGATIANANGSFNVDASGNVSANDVTAVGDVTGATFANTTDTFTVNADGDITSGDVSATGNVTATGNVQGATFSNTGNTFSVNADGDVTAADVTASGALTGATIANANGSFSVDASGNVSGNDVTAIGDVTGATFANTTDTFTVNADGDITSGDVSATGNVTATGNVQGVTFSNTGNTFSVNADGDVTAADVTASGALTGATIANANNSFKVDTSGNVSANNVTALGGVSGTTFANTLNTFAVDADGNITGESIIVDGKTYISSSGLNANGSVISNVGEGEVSASSTDAVNGSQLYKVQSQIKTYKAGDGVAIDGSNVVSVKKGDGIDFDTDGNVTVKAAQDGNIVVNANGVSLSKEVSGLTSLSTDALAVTNNATVDGTLGVTGATTLGALTTNGTATFSQGASMNGQKITGVQAGTAGTDAVNRSQLDAVQSQIKTYTAGDGIAIDEGDNNKISIKKGNGIEFDSSGNVTVKAAQDGNLVVDANGVSLSKTVSGLTSLSTAALEVTNNATVSGTLSVTGAISGGSVTAGTGLFSTSVTIGNATSGLKLADGEITGLVTNKIDSDTDAVNVEYLEDYVSKNGTGKTYTAGNGIAIDEADNNKISVKTAADGNLKVDSNGVALKDEISLTSVTTSGAVTVRGTLGVTGATTLGALTTNGTAIFSQGASMNGQKITGVQAGTAGTDAVNRSQLDAVQSQIKTYTAGDGIAIDEGDNNKISIKKGNGIEFDSSGNVTVKAAQDGNIVVDANGVSLSKTVSGLTSLSTAALAVTNNATVSGTLGVTGAVTAGSVTAGSVTATGGFTIDKNNSLTSSGLTIGGTAYVTSAGLNAGGNVITNVKNGVNDNDAVNMSQLKEVKEVSDLAVTYTANTNKSQVYLQGANGTTITNVAAGNISSAESKDAVNGGQLYATNQIVGDGDYSSNNFLIDSTATGGMDLTEAASALDKAIGTLKFTGNDAVLADSYTNVTDAVSTLDRNIGSLKFTGRNVLSAEKMTSATSALDALDRAVGSVDFKDTPYLGTAYTNLTSATDKLASAMSNIAGIVGIRTDASGNPMNIDWGDDHPKIDPSASVVTAIKGIDTRVMTLETAGNALSAFSRSNISTLSALSNMDVSAVNALSSLSADDLSKLSEISVASDVSGAAETSGTNTTNNSGRPDRGPGSGADDSISHDGDTVTVDNNVKVTGDTDLQGNLNVGGDTTLGGKLEVGGDANFNGNVDMNGTLNMNNNKITGVAAGEISESSTDAVNGSQLWQTNQQVAANTENIGILGSAVNKLGDRIERVGAGAAALAALHPLDFDPDNKLDFAAGFGNYRGASAVAVGAFYRPSENVMFSIGGAFGGGEDMVNAGVSFKVGAGSGSATTSRTAMAKSLKSMQEVVATQDAQLAQQREQIEKLTAMVELLMEQSGQTQPKDDGADTAQPQQ